MTIFYHIPMIANEVPIADVIEMVWQRRASVCDVNHNLVKPVFNSDLKQYKELQRTGISIAMKYWYLLYSQKNMCILC